MQTLNEQEWERIQQTNILATVQQAFSGTASTPGNAIASTTAAPSPQEVMPPSSPLSAAAADTQSLVAAIQDQLDLINREMRYNTVHKKCLLTNNLKLVKERDH